MKTSPALHAAGSSDCWFTPRSLIDSLGRFDTDPCNSMPGQFPTAATHYGPAEDGLSKEWAGRVWLNPPFSDARPWVEKLSKHGNGILLCFARVDAVWFQRAVAAAGAVFFMKGRVEFSRPTGRGSRCPLGCVLIPFGSENRAAIKAAELPGIFLVAA